MFGQYLTEVRRLMELKRYPTRIMIRKRSVAEHSWFVTEIAHGLAMWEKYKFDKHTDLDLNRVVLMAQKHDILEAHTGDILPSVKNMSKQFKEALANSERRIVHEHLINTIPNSWGELYIGIHEEMSDLETVESKLVKSADLIDRVYECMDEILRGNKLETEEILISDLERLSDMGLLSVDYFLKYSLQDIPTASNYLSECAQLKLACMDFSKYF